jgi:hypothetical protein
VTPEGLQLSVGPSVRRAKWKVLRLREVWDILGPTPYSSSLPTIIYISCTSAPLPFFPSLYPWIAI